MLIECLCELIYITQVLMGMKYLFQLSLTKKTWKYVIALIILVAAKVYFILPGQTLPEAPIIYILETLTVLFLVEGKVFRKWCLYLVVDIISATFQIFLMYIVFLATNKSFKVMEGSWEIDFFGGILAILFMLILIKFIKKYSQFLKLITWYQILIIFIGGSLLLSTIIQVESSLRSTTEDLNRLFNKGGLMLFVGFGLLFFIGAFLFILIDNSRKYYIRESELKDEFLEMQKKYYNMLSCKNEELKKFRHDMKNHYFCMENLLQDKKHNELGQYLESFGVQLLNVIEKPFESGNDLVNAILAEISSKGNKYGIEILLKGFLPSELTMKTIDLCSLFYNLASNAEEACERYMGESKKEILLELGFYKENFTIHISNPVNKPVDIKNLGKNTSKKDKENHGYGIQNITDIVNRYNGTIDFFNQEEKFAIEIILCNVMNQSHQL